MTFILEIGSDSSIHSTDASYTDDIMIEKRSCTVEPLSTYKTYLQSVTYRNETKCRVSVYALISETLLMVDPSERKFMASTPILVDPRQSSRHRANIQSST